MRWPKLVRAMARSVQVECAADVDGIDEDGAPMSGGTWSGPANWQDHSSENYSKDMVETDVRASVYIDGDPFPSVVFISGGTVRAFGEEREIVSGTKARNLDGTVNFTRLDLR